MYLDQGSRDVPNVFEYSQSRPNGLHWPEKRINSLNQGWTEEQKLDKSITLRWMGMNTHHSRIVLIDNSFVDHPFLCDMQYFDGRYRRAQVE